MWAIVLVSAWVLLQLATILLVKYLGAEIETCPFKALTTLPCPTCGATRSVLAAAHGRIGEAFGFNPLLFIAAVGGLVYMAVRVIFTRKLSLKFTARQRHMMLLAGAILLLANWAYVIAFVG